MSRGLSRITRLLVEVIETRLNHGAGDLTPELDELAIDFKRRAGGTLREAADIITARLDAALAVLTDDGWVSVKVTSHYIDRYKGQRPNHPDTDAEIARCVAGRGTGLPTAAVHFCVDGQDCVLFIEASIHGLQSGEGANGKTIGRMRVAAESGQLTIQGTDLIVAAIPKHVTLSQVRRIAGKTGPS